jgi:hypothetical protein
MALRGVVGQHHASAELFPGKRDPVPMVRESEWASGSVWTAGKKIPPPGFDPRTVQSVASRYTYCNIPALFQKLYVCSIKFSVSTLLSKLKRET